MGVQLVGSAKLMRFVNDTKVNIVCWANYETQHIILEFQALEPFPDIINLDSH